MGELFTAFANATGRAPDKIGLIEPGGNYTYADILERAEQWAALFLDTAQGRRPCVALTCESLFDCVSVALGVARVDGICVPCNPKMTTAQLQRAWESSGVSMVVYDTGQSNVMSAAPGGNIEFFDTHAQPKGPRAKDDQFPWSDEKDFLIILSSGSTGTPKPISLSQSVKRNRAQQTWDLFKLTPDDVVLCASPFFHSLGQRLSFVPLLLGARLVNIGGFRASNWLSAVAEHQVTFTISVSSHLYALKDSLLENAEQLRSLRTIVTSSAPIDSEFKHRLYQAIGCDFHEIYGATEVAVATSLGPEDTMGKYHTVGRPCPGVSVKIIDEDGGKQPPGEIGEIAVKSPLAFEGYYSLPQMTEAAVRDGYVLTGDLGKMDPDGFLIYVGRKKDIIISGGINIYPKDIETVLAEHPEVIEVSVIGIEYELLGEMVVAVCATRGAKNIERELNAIAVERLAPFQRPLMYFFEKELPRNPVGKVVKMDLSDTYRSKAQEFAERYLPLFQR